MATNQVPGTALRLRRRVGAATLPLLFVALLAATALDKLDDKASQATQVRQASAHLGLLRPLAAVELLAAFLSVAVVATLAGAVRRRGAGWANAGAVIGALGSVGMTLIGLHHLFMYALITDVRPDAARILDTLDNAAPWVFPLFFGVPVALLLFGIAAYRAGLVPVPALVLVGLFVVTSAVDALPGGALISLVVGLVAFSWIAWSLVHQPAAAQPRPAKLPAQLPAAAS